MKTGKGIIILNGKRISDPAMAEELKPGDVISFGSTPAINPIEVKPPREQFLDLIIAKLSIPDQIEALRIWRENDASWDAHLADMICQQWAGISVHVRETGQMPPLDVDSSETALEAAERIAVDYGRTWGPKEETLVDAIHAAIIRGSNAELERKREAERKLKMAMNALRNHHYCEIAERGKGPCPECDAIAEITALDSCAKTDQGPNETYGRVQKPPEASSGTPSGGEQAPNPGSGAATDCLRCGHHIGWHCEDGIGTRLMPNDCNHSFCNCIGYFAP